MFSRQIMWQWVLLGCSLVFLAALAIIPKVQAQEASLQDVSELLDILRPNPILSRRSPDARFQITLRNHSDVTILAPAKLKVTGLVPSSVSIAGAERNEAGDYLVDISAVIGEGLAPGDTSSVIALVVSGGGRVSFDFSSSVLATLPAEEEIFSVRITEPASLITVGSSPVDVVGEVTDGDAVLTLNGVPMNNDSGAFSADVNLEEGLNNVIVSATAADGTRVTDSIVVSLDLTPPYLTVESHEQGQTVYSDVITVTGLVNDIVRGTIEETQANVTVNGVVASISNRSYAARDVPVFVGNNVITIAGSDQVGNSAVKTLNIVYEPPMGKRIEIVSGQDQSAGIGGLLAAPLAVKVLDEALAPVANESVVFRVTQGSGAVGAGTDGEGRAIVIDTDAQGMATTAYRLGLRAGTANHKVKAQVVGYPGEQIFNASAVASIGDKISVNSGNNQRGAVGQALPAPFVVAVTDAGANVVAGARVEFSVAVGGGAFVGGDSAVVVQTDSDGRATASYVVGDLVGLDVQRVTATLLDGPEGQALNAGFTVSALVAGDPGETRISGVILDNQDTPIPGVTVRVDGTTRQAVSDEEGQFLITEVPVGPVHLIADGSTATLPGEFPSLSYNLVTVAGQENPLSSPIYMVKLDTDNAVLAGPAAVSLTLDAFPGFQLDIARDSVTFPDGARQGFVSVTPVNASKVPMAPPNGMQPQFIVTIQPAGTRFDPPATLTLPNVDAHQSGAQVEMYSYDHDLEEFVSIGLGTVSEDGSVVKSNPGVGVIKAGWHCGSQPGGSGCTHSCSICKDCDGSCNCVNSDDDPRLGQCETCENGSKKAPPTDAECCTQDAITSDADYVSGSLLGTVTCCRGQAALCMYRANFPASGNDKGDEIGFDCVSVHEAKHFEHVTCEGDDCETWPSFKDGVTPAQGECEASKAEKECLDEKRSSCEGEEDCEDVVDDWIQEAIDYGNGFGSCFSSS